MKTIYTILLLLLPVISFSQTKPKTNHPLIQDEKCCDSRFLVAKFRVYQAATLPPEIIMYQNPNNYTLTSVRDSDGVYRILGFTGQQFTNTNFMYEMEFNANALLGNSTVDIYPSTDESIVLRTYDNTGTLGDNIIFKVDQGNNALWHVVAIYRYKV